MAIIKLLHRIFVVNGPRKIVAFFAALILWFSLNQSLTVTKNFSSIPIKVIHLPKGKTIVGLQPDGLLEKRVSLSITGKKEFLSELTPHNLEILINAEGKQESWIAKLDKSSLISLSPRLDLQSNITSVQGNDLFMQLIDTSSERLLLTLTDEQGKKYHFTVDRSKEEGNVFHNLSKDDSLHFQATVTAE